VEPDDLRLPGGPILTTDECQRTAGLRQQIEAQLMELDAWMEALRWTSTVPKPDGTVDETLQDMIYSLNDPPCRAGFCHARGPEAGYFVDDSEAVLGQFLINPDHTVLASYASWWVRRRS
ncbi:MAG TPA: hypothetical protein VGW38_25770, partial [Chloroflexota bacterium]|nr:hypothetical protein [Chloroflexota bacterium]